MHSFTFAMPVPQSWWERALKTGQVDDTHASVLRESLAALSNVVEAREDLNYGLLVALAFVKETVRRVGFQIARTVKPRSKAIW